MLENLLHGNRVVGIKQLRRALAENRVKTVFLAQDADPALTQPIEAACREKGVDFRFVSTMKELGAACGISVGAAAAASLM